MGAVAASIPALALAGLALLPQGGGDCARIAEDYRALLASWRSGDETVAADLVSAGRELGSACGRPDAEAVAAYYMGLSAAERRAGLEQEARFAELYEAVQEAGRAGLAGEAWRAERGRLLRELRALAERSRTAADYVPAARALSLAARLEVEALELDPELDADLVRPLMDTAKRDAVEARGLLDRSGLLTPQLEPVWLLARLDLLARRFAASRRGFEAVLALARRVDNDDFREHALRGLARLARAAGDARGEDRLLVELAGFRDPRESWPLARDWAARLLSEDHAEEALDFLERCEPSAEAHRLDRLEWHLSLGAALSRLGELEQARAHLEEAASSVPSETAVLALAQLALEEGRAFELYELLADPTRTAGFSERGRAEARRLLGEQRLAEGDVEAAVSELELALGSAEGWRAGIAPHLGEGRSDGLGPGGVESVFGEWAGLHTLALYADAQCRAGRPLEALRRIAEGHSRSLREARAGPDALRALAAGQDPGRISVLQLNAWVRRTELGLVAWVVGSDFTVVVHAWFADGEIHARGARLPLGRAATVDLARRLREAAIAGEPARLAREAAAARAALLPEEIAAGLATQAAALGRDARVLLVVHGPLERLPFELLALMPDGALLDELCAPVALPGLPDPAPPTPLGHAALQAWSLLGPPPALPGFPHLAAAERELEQILALHPDSQRRRAEAFTSESLEAALRSGRALHVATHLVADEVRQGGPALLAARGARVGADFVRERAAPLPLVVLPACETGGGTFVDAQGLHGLARAFLESGTRQLVVTLWPVLDESAARFSIAFHEALSRGLPPSLAAREARTTLRRAGAGAAEWAAFRVLGID